MLIFLAKDLKYLSNQRKIRHDRNLPKTQRTSVAAYIILGDPFLVIANAPILPEYDVTPQPDPIRPAQRQANPSMRIPLLTPSDGTGGAATIRAAAK